MDSKTTNDAIGCPWCGYEHDDTDNRADSRMDGKMECGECGNEFKYESDFTIHWITVKVHNA